MSITVLYIQLKNIINYIKPNEKWIIMNKFYKKINNTYLFNTPSFLILTKENLKELNIFNLKQYQDCLIFDKKMDNIIIINELKYLMIEYFNILHFNNLTNKLDNKVNDFTKLIHLNYSIDKYIISNNYIDFYHIFNINEENKYYELFSGKRGFTGLEKPISNFRIIPFYNVKYIDLNNFKKDIEKISNNKYDDDTLYLIYRNMFYYDYKKLHNILNKYKI